MSDDGCGACIRCSTTALTDPSERPSFDADMANLLAIVDETQRQETTT